MASVFRKTATKKLPANAEIIIRKGERFARWKDGRGMTKIVCEDFRDVGGMSLPFRVEARHANRFIGTAKFQFDSAEFGVDASNLLQLSKE